MGLELFSVYGTVTLDDSEFYTGIGRAENRGRSFASKLGGALAKSAVAMKAALAGIGAGAIAVGNKYDQSMATISARTGMTERDIESLGMVFRDMSLDGVFSANEIAKAYGYVAVAGNDTTHAILLMESSMKFAQATGTSLANSTELLNLALMKNQKDVSYAESYMNIFASTAQLSGMSVGNLQKAVIALAPTMSQSDDSMQAMNGTLATLYQGGLYGISAARGLEQIFNSLVSPTNAAEQAMYDLGFSMFDMDGNVKSLTDAMPELMYKLDGVTDAQTRLNLQNDLFSTVYARAVFDELSRNQSAWQESMKSVYAMSEATGEYGIAAVMAAERTLSFNQALGMINHSGQDMLKTVWRIIEAPLAGVLGKAAEKAQELAIRLRPYGDLHPIVQQLGTAIARLGETIVNLATRAIEPTIRVLTFFSRGLTTALDIFTNFTPSVLAVVAAFKLWKPALAIQSTIQRVSTAITSMTGVVKAHAAAQNISAVSAAHLANADRMRRQAAEQTAVADAAAASVARNRQKAEYHLAIAKKGGTGADAHRAKAAALSKKADMDSTAAGVARKKALNAQTAATNLDTKAQVANTGALKGGALAKGVAAAAMAKLNGVMKANPIGFVIAGIAGLVAITTALVGWLNRETEASKAIRLETERLAAAREESARSVTNVTGAVRASAEAHERKISSIEAESTLTRTLIAEIEALSSVENRSEAQKAQLANAVARLNEQMGDTVFTINSETGAINENTSAIRGRIEAARGEERIAVMRQRQNEVYMEQISLATERTRVHEEWVQQSLERAEIDTRIAEIEAQRYNRWRNNWREEQAALPALRNKRDELNDAMQQSYEAYYKIAGQMDGLTAEYAAFADRLEETAAAVQGFGDEVKQVCITAVEYLQNLAKIQAEAMQSLATEFDTVRDRASNAFSAMNYDTRKNIDEINYALANNIEVTRNWGNYYAGTMARLRGLLGSEFEAMQGDFSNWANKGAGYARMLYTATDEQLRDMAANFAELTNVSVENVSTRFSVGEDIVRAAAYALGGSMGEGLYSSIQAANFDGMGASIPQSIADGVGSKADVLTGMIGELGEETVNALKSIWVMNSPSQVFIDIGQGVPNSIADGIWDTMSDALNAMRSLGDELVNKAKNILSFNVFENIGWNMINGLVNAIHNGTHMVVSAVTSMANAAVQAAQSALQIGSPSRKFEYMGDMSIEGYVNSIYRGIGKVEKALSDTFSFDHLPNVKDLQFAVDSSMLRSTAAQQLITVNLYNTFNLDVDSEIDVHRLCQTVSRELGLQVQSNMRARGLPSPA